MKNAVATAMRMLEALLGLLLIATILLNFVNVVGRYVFNESVLGAEEVQVYALIWIAFLGAGIVTWRNMHLRMDALSKRLPAALQSALRLCELLLVLAVTGFALLQSWTYVSRMMMLGAISDVSHLPMWTVHAAVLCGLALILLMTVAAAMTGGSPPVQPEGGEQP